MMVMVYTILVINRILHIFHLPRRQGTADPVEPCPSLCSVAPTFECSPVVVAPVASAHLSAKYTISTFIHGERETTQREREREREIDLLWTDD